MRTLRSSLIHLAVARPELRADLLPLLKTAGYSFAVETGYFVAWGKGTFNVDVIKDIQNAEITFYGDDEEEHVEHAMRVGETKYGPLTIYRQEQMGITKEIVFSVRYPEGAGRDADIAIQAVCKAHGLLVERLPRPRAPGLREKNRVVTGARFNHDFSGQSLKVREGSIVVVRGAFGSGRPEQVTVDDYSSNIKNGQPGIDYTTSTGETKWCYMDQVDRVIKY